MTSVTALIACLGPIALGPAGTLRTNAFRPAAPLTHEGTAHDPWLPTPKVAPAGSIERSEPWIREAEEGDSTSLFYTHRNANGLILKGRSVDLGELEDVRRIVSTDDALLIKSGSVIYTWPH